MTRRLCLMIMICLSLGVLIPSHAENISPQALAAYDVFSDCDRVEDVSQEECLGLVALHFSTNGQEWTNQSGWLSDTAVCTWYGVECMDGQIVGLDLATNNLQGELPQEISYLSHLHSLKLHQNQLTGLIPESLWNLSNLEILFLSRNQLSGVVSGNINKASQLQMLVLSSNQLSGELPLNLWDLPHLTLLALSNNQLTGTLPSEVAHLQALEGLYLADNRLSGQLPPELGLLANLQDLDLRFNQFEGEVPANLAQLPRLETGNDGTYFTAKGLNLHYNALYTSNPDLAAYLENKNIGWLSTQTSAPLNLQADPLAGDTVTLTWIPTGYNPLGSYFEIYYSISGTNDYLLAGTTDANFYRLVGLDPSATYDFQVINYTPTTQHNNNELWSRPSRALTVAMANNPVEAAALPPSGGGDEPTTGVTENLGGNTTSQGFSQDDYIQAVLPRDLLAPALGNAVVVAYELNLRTLPTVGSERIDILSYGTYVQVLGQYQYPFVDHGLNSICPTTHGFTGGQRWLQISVNGLMGWADARWLYYGNGTIESYEGILTTFSWQRNPNATSFEAVVIAHEYPSNVDRNVVVRSAPTFGQTAEQVIPATHVTGRIGAVLGTDRGQIDDGSVNPFADGVTHPCGGHIEAIGRTGDNLWIEIISADGVHGWVYHQYLEVKGNASALPITYGAPDLDGVGMCARVDAYLRLGAGIEYQEIGLIHQNQTVIAFAQSPDLEWIQVETLDGLFGWTQRILYQESNTGIRVMPVPPPPYDVDLDTMPGCNPFLGTQASVDPEPDLVLGTVSLPNGLFRAYNIEPVTLRNGPGFEYTEIGFIRSVPMTIPGYGASDVGQQVAVVDFDPSLQWIFIQASDGQRGWALASSFRDSTTLEPLVLVPVNNPQVGDFAYTEPPDDLAYNIETVTVRAGPNLSYEELGVLQFVPTTIPSSGQSTQVGQLVRLLARSADNEWVLVQATDGLLGWASRSSFYDNETLLPLTDISHLRVAP